MTNYEYSKIAKVSDKAVDTITEVFDELNIAEIERRTLTNLLIALVRNERTYAALEAIEIFKYNYKCN